jgi:hypothetical protein
MKHIIAAMKNQAFANFGYVHLGHTSSEITELRKALEINCHDCENALVFKDEPEVKVDFYF